MPEQYYSIAKVKKILGVTAQTLRNWDRTGKLKPHHVGPNGYRYYSREQIDQLLQVNAPDYEKVTIGYCRVPSPKQKDDLKRQEAAMEAYLTAQGKPYKIISDIGSGINYSKPGLRQIIREMTEGKAGKVVVLYKDRLLRFGFELVEYVASLHGCSIEVIDHTEKTEQQELVEDLVQIITVFSCRLQGKRAGKARRLIAELTEKPDKNSVSKGADPDA